jgi:CDP-paratose 2-epimerase
MKTNSNAGSTPVPLIGFVEWFTPGEFDRVENVIAKLRSLGITELRTGVSWADWYTSEGDGWYAWLLPRLARDFNILPCFVYTPPSLGLVPKYSSPPQTPKAYADFLDVMITRFGKLFEWMELWNRPDDSNEWDFRLDPDWHIFTEMIGGAAYWAHDRGKKTVLPGVWPGDPSWIKLMHDRGVLKYIDAVGMHGFPGSPEHPWQGWINAANAVHERLMRVGSKAQVWITATGSSTWRDDEGGQSRALIDALDASVDRVYWREVQDRIPSTIDSFHSDEREYHYGLTRANGTPKRLFSLWSKGGISAVRESLQERVRPSSHGRSRRHVLITGGAGFIGTNLADRLLCAGRSVMLYDDLSRPGVERNVRWLRKQHGESVRVEIADIRNREMLRPAVRAAESVFHFAAQVAVTTSLTNPLHDFEVNIGGTLNLLEELRSLTTPVPLMFTSTNKVYGALADLELEKNCTRYLPLDKALRSGVSEARPLDFHSPYGCSKGAADQYVLDYARTFGLPATVFRMSCIYGLHQMGTEDQGWVAHFLLRALRGEPIAIYGDGMQVRDVLFVDDLVDAFLLAHGNIHSVSGQAFNIGGGLGNTLSLVELLDLIGVVSGSKPEIRTEEWRCGDQRYYVSDTTKFKAATGWSPKVSAHEGVKRLFRWLKESHQPEIPHVLSAKGGSHAVLPY